jgi:TM2 domain-containing membrane protein YozV
MKWLPKALLVGILFGCLNPGAAIAAEGTGRLLGPDRVYDSRELLRTVSARQEPSLQLEQPKKSSKLAMLYSFLLPGLGEQYLGHTGRAKVFFVLEGITWTSFAVFRIQGSHREDLYKEFAEVHAGPSQRNDDEFYRTIGNFIASDGPFSANEQVRRIARSRFPNDREAQDQFFADNAYTGDDAWSWESEDRLDAYKGLRTSSLDAFHRSELAVGVMVANRLLSVIDVGILASRRNRDHADDQARLSWNLEADADGPGAQVTLSRTF